MRAICPSQRPYDSPCRETLCPYHPISSMLRVIRYKTLRGVRVRRILSIDGGGLKGALPAAFLAEIETVTGKRIVDHFDLIAGTSTGGIIALGLGLGVSAGEIVQFYQNRGPEVFGQAGPKSSLLDRIARKVRRVIRTKYDPGALRRALTDVFGEGRLGDSQTRLLVPAYNSDHRSVHVFKTSHHDRLRMDWRVSAVDVALATAAAPTFFAQHVMENGIGLIDGGVWANNPSGFAVVEAAAVLGWDPKEVRVLSLGCVEEAIALAPDAGLGCVRKIIDVIMQGQSFGSAGIAQLMLGHPHERQAYHRYSPVIRSGFAALDDASKIREFIGLGCTEARRAMPTVISDFIDPGLRAPFIPCHFDEKSVA